MYNTSDAPSTDVTTGISFFKRRRMAFSVFIAVRSKYSRHSARLRFVNLMRNSPRKKIAAAV
jgi:hypothetical protein